MKKILFMFSAALLTAAIFTSCEDDNVAYEVRSQEPTGTENPVPEPSVVDPTVDLLTDLYVFNDSLCTATQAELSGDLTRGRWRDLFKKLASIVCADISGARDGAAVGALFGGEGAAIGATVGAALFSFRAGADTFGEMMGDITRASDGSISQTQLQVERAYAATMKNNTAIDNMTTIQINLPSAYAVSATQVGKSHNAILNLCQNDTDEAATIEEVTGTLTNAQIAVIHSVQFVSMINKAISTGNYTVDESDTVGNQIIDMFMDVFEECAASQTDLHYIINRYISIIETNGSLSEDVKTQIYNALSVAAYSCDYWENYAQ